MRVNSIMPANIAGNKVSRNNETNKFYHTNYAKSNEITFKGVEKETNKIAKAVYAGLGGIIGGFIIGGPIGVIIGAAAGLRGQKYGEEIMAKKEAEEAAKAKEAKTSETEEIDKIESTKSEITETETEEETKTEDKTEETDYKKMYEELKAQIEASKSDKI